MSFWAGPSTQARWQLWARIIRHGGALGSSEELIVVALDDSTKKKAGRHIEGVGHYRNSAGSARQEYRTLRGFNFVLGIMRVPLPRWPGHCVSVPIGLSNSISKHAQARKLGALRSRSPWPARSWILWPSSCPERAIRGLADGGYATKDYLRPLPHRSTWSDAC